MNLTKESTPAERKLIPHYLVAVAVGFLVPAGVALSYVASSAGMAYRGTGAFDWSALAVVITALPIGLWSMIKWARYPDVRDLLIESKRERRELNEARKEYKAWAKLHPAHAKAHPFVPPHERTQSP